MRNKTETTEYLEMLTRMIRAAGKRVADGDEPELIQMVGVRDQFDEVLKTAIQGQNKKGRSWAQIGEILGISRQGAFQRYGRKTR